MNPYQNYIHLSRYARWRDGEGRRETWSETVDRYCNFIVAHCAERFGVYLSNAGATKGSTPVAHAAGTVLSNVSGKGCYPAAHGAGALGEIRSALLGLEVMPSMRALMTAGPALARDNMAGFNCSFLPVDSPRAFDEIMYILLCGTGVGFSVEKSTVSRLPPVSEEFHPTDTIIVVADSKIGWASSFRELLSLLWAGKVPKWDLSRVRAAGSRLRIFGGRASGPAPLDSLFHFSVEHLKRAAGRKMTSLECHDLVCKIADVVVSGGVRRSALISLSGLSDDRMRNAKNGQWWIESPHRALANNSAVYTEKPDFDAFLREWTTLYQSKSGERGILNRVASEKKAAENGRRELGKGSGTNPCGEIILRPYGLCNLSEVVVRPGDLLSALKHKVSVAAALGTIQSTFTDFRYTRSIWKRNADEERLLGVSLTGIMDHEILSGRGVGGASHSTVLEHWLRVLRATAVETNAHWAEMLGIPPSAAITCVKPSGTVSQLVNAASGIHPRYSRWYIRTVRSAAQDPMTQYLKDAGVPWEPCVMKGEGTVVFSWPQRASSASVLRDECSALEQLELYLCYRRHWCEHNPSITVYYKDSEFLGVGQWVWEHWDEVGGVSFLPYSDHIYKQAPYQPCTEKEYEKATAQFPFLDWSHLAKYESDESTSATGGVGAELACTAGECEL